MTTIRTIQSPDGSNYTLSNVSKGRFPFVIPTFWQDFSDGALLNSNVDAWEVFGMVLSVFQTLSTRDKRYFRLETSDSNDGTVAANSETKFTKNNIPIESGIAQGVFYNTVNSIVVAAKHQLLSIENGHITVSNDASLRNKSAITNSAVRLLGIEAIPEISSQTIKENGTQRILDVAVEIASAEYPDRLNILETLIDWNSTANQSHELQKSLIQGMVDYSTQSGAVSFSDMSAQEMAACLAAHYKQNSRTPIQDIIPLLKDPLQRHLNGHLENKSLTPGKLELTNAVALQLLRKNEHVNLEVQDGNQVLITIHDNDPIVYESSVLASVAYLTKHSNWYQRLHDDQDFRYECGDYLAKALTLLPEERPRFYEILEESNSSEVINNILGYCDSLPGLSDQTFRNLYDYMKAITENADSNNLYSNTNSKWETISNNLVVNDNDLSVIIARTIEEYPSKGQALLFDCIDQLSQEDQYGNEEKAKSALRRLFKTEGIQNNNRILKGKDKLQLGDSDYDKLLELLENIRADGKAYIENELSSKPTTKVLATATTKVVNDNTPSPAEQFKQRVRRTVHGVMGAQSQFQLPQATVMALTLNRFAKAHSTNTEPVLPEDMLSAWHGHNQGFNAGKAIEALLDRAEHLNGAETLKSHVPKPSKLATAELEQLLQSLAIHYSNIPPDVDRDYTKLSEDTALNTPLWSSVVTEYLTNTATDQSPSLPKPEQNINKPALSVAQRELQDNLLTKLMIPAFGKQQPAWIYTSIAREVGDILEIAIAPTVVEQAFSGALPDNSPPFKTLQNFFELLDDQEVQQFRNQTLSGADILLRQKALELAYPKGRQLDQRDHETAVTEILARASQSPANNQTFETLQDLLQSESLDHSLKRVPPALRQALPRQMLGLAKQPDKKPDYKRVNFRPLSPAQRLTVQYRPDTNKLNDLHTRLQQAKSAVDLEHSVLMDAQIRTLETRHRQQRTGTQVPVINRNMKRSDLIDLHDYSQQIFGIAPESAKGFKEYLAKWTGYSPEVFNNRNLDRRLTPQHVTYIEQYLDAHNLSEWVPPSQFDFPKLELQDYAHLHQAIANTRPDLLEPADFRAALQQHCLEDEQVYSTDTIKSYTQQKSPHKGLSTDYTNPVCRLAEAVFDNPNWRQDLPSQRQRLDKTVEFDNQITAEAATTRL